MAWIGYMTLDGAEIANMQRFEAYATGTSWFHPLYATGELGQMLNQTYTTPIEDNAEWYDPDVPVSADFFGFYPVASTGLEDSSRTVSVVESTRDGGIPGRVRHATKEVNISGFLAGHSEEAVEYGLRWLRRALLGAVCSPLDARKQALGAELRLLGTEPRPPVDRASDGDSVEVDTDGEPYVGFGHSGVLIDPDVDGVPFYGGTIADLGHDTDDIPFVLPTRPDRTPVENLDYMLRRFRRVVVSSGPEVLSSRRLGCGDYIATVQFTLTFGDPFEYTTPQRIFSGLFLTEVDTPGGTTIPPTWGQFVTSGSVLNTTVTEVACGAALWAPLYDPECAVVITPPTPPNVALGCWTAPEEGAVYPRTVVTVPAANLSTYAEMLPIITLTNSRGTMRNVRIRFWRDTGEDLDLAASPCAWVSDIVVSYLPLGYMVIDGTNEDVHFTTSGGHTRRADSLIFGTDQRPVIWPVLDCGSQYLITIDTLSDDPNVPVIDLDLVGRYV